MGVVVARGVGGGGVVWGVVWVTGQSPCAVTVMRRFVQFRAA